MLRSNASGGTDAIAPRTKRSTSYPQLRVAIVHHWPYASAPKRSATSPRRSRWSLRDGRRDPERDRIGGMTETPGLLRSGDSSAAETARKMEIMIMNNGNHPTMLHGGGPNS